MGVTTAVNDEELSLVAKFLNTKETSDFLALKAAHKLSGDEAKLRQAQEELIHDIDPLIARGLSRQHLADCLKALVEKINGLGLEHMWLVRDPIPWSTVLRLGRGKWSLQRADVLSRIDNPRKFFYDKILSGLLDGTFSKLRRCTKCKSFYVTSHLGRKYCPPCSKAVETKKAAKRMRNMRERKKGEQKKERVQAARALKEKPFKRFCEFYRLASKNNPSEVELLKLRPILKALGKGDLQKGWQVVKKWPRNIREEPALKDLWRGLPEEVKKIFESDEELP